MRWFRDHIRHGSWLALVAIAIVLLRAIQGRPAFGG